MINAVRERLRFCWKQKWLRLSEHGAGIQSAGAFLVRMLSVFPRWPRADTGTRQECDSTIWPKRNETSHVRNAGSSVSWTQSYQRPREVFVVLQMQSRFTSDKQMLLERNNSFRRMQSVLKSKMLNCRSAGDNLLLPIRMCKLTYK